MGQWTCGFYVVTSSSKLYLRMYNSYSTDNDETRNHEIRSPNFLVH